MRYKIKINKIKELKVMYKKCNKCGNVIFHTKFDKDKSKKYGIKNICKQCASSRHKKECILCGKIFTTSKKNQLYCSIDCLSKSQIKRITVKCDYCGKDYETQECLLKNKNNHYCSNECKNKAHSLNMRKENNPRYNSENIKCDYCGKDFFRSESGIGEHNFCSPKCYWEYRKIHYTKENHSSWNPNLTEEERIKKRHYEEYDIWRKLVFERDNYTCQCCKKDTHNNVAHHLDGYNWCENKRTDIDNGVTLCNKCHKKFHSIYGYGNNTKEQFEEFINNIISYTNEIA